MEEAAQKNRHRKTHTKSRTGCAECRKRHIKCDESQPACTRCVKAGRQCSGRIGAAAVVPRKPLSRFRIIRNSHYTDKFKQTVKAPIAAPISSHIKYTDLDFFSKVTVPLLSRFCPSSFWNRSLRQLIHSEDAIKFAARAIGTHHQQYLTSDSQPSQDTEPNKWYSYALQSLRELTSREAPQRTVVALACLLLIIYASLERRLEDTFVHLNSGVRLLMEAQPCDSDIHQEMLLQIHGISTSTLPFRYDRRIYHLIKELPLHLVSSSGLSRVEQLRFEADVLTTDIFEFSYKVTFGLEDFAEIQKSRQSLLSRLDSACSNILSEKHKSTTTEGETNGSHDQMLLGCLEARGLFGSLFVKSVVSRYQTTYDVHLDTFRHIAHILETSFGISEDASMEEDQVSERAPLSLHLGVIPSILMMVMLCRNRDVRRRFWRLLHHCPRREGVWDAEEMADMAKAVIEFEDRMAVGFRDESVPPFIPEEGRVHYISRAPILNPERTVKARDMFVILKPRANGELVEKRISF